MRAGEVSPALVRPVDNDAVSGVAVVEALVCVEPGKLELQERGAPRAGADLALVRPRRIGICGTDYHILQGMHPYLQYPRVMGHELAVEVIDAPTESGLSSGDLCVVNPYLSCGRCIACRKEKPNCCANISVLGVHRDGGRASSSAMPTTPRSSSVCIWRGSQVAASPRASSTTGTSRSTGGLPSAAATGR
jgi:threonine dehydrogenase-like Zn-dependent dehydrogenase